MFYSDPNGNLSYFKSQIEGESIAGAATVPLYEKEKITVDNRPVAPNTKSPQFAAVSYTFKGQDEVFAHSPRRRDFDLVAKRPSRFVYTTYPTKAICRNGVDKTADHGRLVHSTTLVKRLLLAPF